MKDLSDEEISKMLENIKEHLSNLPRKRRRELIITCPLCGREGILKLKKRGANYKFYIEHWIVHGEDRESLPLHKKNDKCLVTFHDEDLFREILSIYLENFEPTPEFYEWLEFYGFL